MDVTYKYAGASGRRDTGDGEALSFSPDLLREPTYFVGAVSNHVAFREAISTLHHVVTSDLRFKPKDRTEYFAWLETQKAQHLAEAATQGKAASERLTTLQSEMNALNRRSNDLMRPFYRQRREYWNWLYKVDRDAWFVLDPVIAVHPDEISFECFSTDESTYGRLSCDLEMFDEIDEVANGVTNIDYSWALYHAFQQVRSYRRTELRVEPGGFTATNTDGQEVFEQKIDLPDSWVRGFLQVSSAMTLPAHRVTLHPMDIHNLCFALRQKKERHSPRSLRFHLKPGAPVTMVFEPWDTAIPCPRAVYHGDEDLEIRLWGRRRLLILERLIPIARSFDLYLLGSGMPTFVVADLGPMKFTLGLSGWTSSDWSRAGQFDLLAPRKRIGIDSRTRVFDSLSSRWLGNTAEIVNDTGLDRSEVGAALTILAQNGRAMYDLDKQVWRYRDVTREPLDFEAMRFNSPQEAAADKLVLAGMAKITSRDSHQITGRVTADGRDYPVTITLDADDRLIKASCTCWHHQTNGLRKGPCEHILALRRTDGQATSGGQVMAGPWGDAS
ncbi:SWIM zinc finger family protein [Actibacterium sp. 188UL27-1]|uniref:SWIM zinc finger family protein n=1 Tax=Actibacterium sp. 188UL27-1 TaxID=2786961 RepID=UPI001957A7C8|nr:SWIM zinc finger family protein [Actibacterium sp. 188UL27-1]MBM7067289.1 SWIM zinc finger family protein [Actibacterium sp. 188UL27-1]